MYINFMIEQNKNKYVCNWLVLITSLVILMIIVGGFTRLTDSGLSITKWDLFKGIIPPFTLEKWNYLFSLYKKIPEYTLQNSQMTLQEFKIIYWWEYIHRLLGRIIGLAYIIPLLFFTFKKYIDKQYFVPLYLIFFLICFQGFIGWYMVESGLTDRVDVSHYRLSLHLTGAFIILILLVFYYLKLKQNNLILSGKKIPFNFPILFTSLILIQISIGALVSGLDAGKIYQTWPLMNQNYFPDDINATNLITFKMLEIPSLVQFIHRNLAYLIFLIFLFFSYLVYFNKSYLYLKGTVILIFLALSLQIILGIFTILSGAQIYIASLHQIGSIFLIITSLLLVFQNYKLTTSF